MQCNIFFTTGMSLESDQTNENACSIHLFSNLQHNGTETITQNIYQVLEMK